MIKERYDLNLLNQYVKKGKFSVEKHINNDIYIYGYTQMDSETTQRIKWDDINVNLRGLIVDSNGKVLSRAFQKFFTFKSYLSDNTVLLSEQQIHTLGSDEYRIFEKVDGTFTILYWINDKPYLATQRSFKSPKAIKATKILHDKYSNCFSKLDKNKTYIFEAIYPETRVLVNNGEEEKLILIGVLDTKTGKELELEDIGFPKAKEYTEELKFVKDLKELRNLDLPNKEGFVVKYGDGLNIKVKFPWYDRAHRVFNNIIAYKNAAFQLEEQLRNILLLPDNKLTKEKVWNLFEKGLIIREIEKDIPDTFYSLGVQEWLNNQYEDYTKYKDMGNALSDYDFSEKEIFDVDNRISLPESESVVWNRINRLIEQYN